MQFFLVIIAEKIKDAENTIQRIKMQTFWPRSVAESAQLGYRSLVGGFSDGVATATGTSTATATTTVVTATVIG